jgi:hypothetical protein
MSCVIRRCAICVAFAVLPACASLPSTASYCDGSTSAAITLESGRTETAADGCASELVASRFQTVGRVEQRGSQTRTVGVPRGFLVALIVLLLIFGLA